MKVWILLFDDVNFWDCNGVFSTKEKAIESFNQHCERCSDIWLNVKKEDEGENWISFGFRCVTENTNQLFGVLIQEEEVDVQ